MLCTPMPCTVFTKLCCCPIRYSDGWHARHPLWIDVGAANLCGLTANMLCFTASLHCTLLNYSAGGAQVIKAVLKDPEDQTEMRLLYANSSPADVLLKAELEAFAKGYDNFSVWFTGAVSGRVDQ